MRLVLWDVDGTLLLTGGAGVRAMEQAFQEVYGLTNGLEGVEPGGKTDPQLVREVFARRGAGPSFEETLPAFFARYLDLFRGELARSASFRVLPGVGEMIARLGREDSILQGLATGNVEEAAHLKLERAGLRAFFSFGGFGSDAENRTDVIRVALERGRARIAPARETEVVVIGDTPLDVLHGKAAGARTIAVASGSYSIEALRAYAPDLLVASLAPMDPVVRFLTS